MKAKSISVACPSCKAPVGHPCIKTTTRLSKKHGREVEIQRQCRQRQRKARKVTLEELDRQQYLLFNAETGSRQRGMSNG